MVVAFALESGTWEEGRSKALAKLKAKHCDWIILNRAGEMDEGPNSQTNSVRVLSLNAEYPFENLEKGALSGRLVNLLLNHEKGVHRKETTLKAAISLV